MSWKIKGERSKFGAYVVQLSYVGIVAKVNHSGWYVCVLFNFLAHNMYCSTFLHDVYVYVYNGMDYTYFLNTIVVMLSRPQ